MRLKLKNRPVKPPTIRTAAIYAVYINILIYLLFAVVFIYGRSAFIPYEDFHQQPPPPLNGWMFLAMIITTYGYIFLLFCLNFYLLRQERYTVRTRTAVSILLSLVFILIWNRLHLTVQQAIFEFPIPDSRVLRGNFARDFVLGTLTVITSQITWLNYRRQQVAIENEALKAEYERARYETLKNQIDPHFLFNTFNTLNSIVGKDPQQAQRYIQKLSAIFRYTIQSRDVTTLADEVGFTKDYCDLMQIRYGDNLEFRFDISAKYNGYSVLPFSVQTLVENAVKHNVITGKQKLIVSLSSGDDDSLTVSNPIQPKIDPEAGEGIGLANLSERYRLKWGKEIAIRSNDGIFSVTLPLIPTQTLKLPEA